MTESRWVVHLPTTLTSLDDAIDLATALRDSLSHVTALDFDELTLSAEDAQFLRHPVWCDAIVHGDARCGLLSGHRDACRE